jgi:hypothetical protein
MIRISFSYLSSGMNPAAPDGALPRRFSLV